MAFSVCVVDKDNMTFDLDRKKVRRPTPVHAQKPNQTIVEIELSQSLHQITAVLLLQDDMLLVNDYHEHEH